jgi:uncharacterized repeat protein (TIGR01451 family)
LVVLLLLSYVFIVLIVRFTGTPLVNVVNVTTARTSLQTATATVNVKQIAMYTISKSTTTTSVNAAGQVIPYTINVRNTGTLLLTNMRVTDTLISNITCTPSLGGSLPVNTTAVCTGSYVVTQANINAGVALVNVATAEFNEIGRQSAQATVSVASKKQRCF